MNAIATILATAQLLFPNWCALWSQRPITPEDLNAPYALTLTDAQVGKAQEGLRQADPNVRQQLILGLRQATQNPQAHATLVAQLTDEQDPATLTVLLQQLLLVNPAIIPAEAVQPLLTHPSPRVAAAAVQLYCQLPAADAALLQPLLATGAPLPVWRAAWAAVSRQPALAGQDLLLANQDQADPTVRAAALTALLQTEFTPAVQAWATRAATPTADPLLRLAVARQLPHLPTEDAVTLGQNLATDSLIAVRITTATSLGELRTAPAVQALLTMLDDADPAVRAATLVALRGQTLQPEEFTRVAAQLADSAAPAREAAESALVAWAKNPELEPTLVDTLGEEDDNARRHAVSALTAIGATSRRHAIAELLPEEELPENQAACILALGQLGATNEFRSLILEQAANRSPQVRAAVAEALGRLRVIGAEPTLITLAGDAAPAVRLSAYIAMGRHRSTQFASSLQKCLENTGMSGSSSSAERAAAAWSAGQIKQAPKPLLSRLVTQCTTPVIPTQMGPVFDSQDVIGNALFALAKVARKNPAAQSLFTSVSAYLQGVKKRPGGANGLTVGPEMAELLRQATLLRNGKPFTPVARPLTEVNLPYQLTAPAP